VLHLVDSVSLVPLPLVPRNVGLTAGMVSKHTAVKNYQKGNFQKGNFNGISQTDPNLTYSKPNLTQPNLTLILA